MSRFVRSPWSPLLGLFLGAALLSSCRGGSEGGAGGEGGPGGPGGGGAMPVTVVTLKAQTVQLTRELPGRTRAYLVAEVRPQVNGIIERRLFEEGGLVKQGQALYQLADATYRADHASARAALDRAEAARTSAELNAKRSTELRKHDAISEAELERAVTLARTAEAEVAAARAALQRATVMLNYARITSPITGRIGKSSVTQGALVTAGQPTALASVQQLDPIYVDLTRSSAELLELRQAVSAGKVERAVQETPVTILLEDGSEYSHPGKLTFSDVTVDPGTGSYSLRVVVPNPEQLLLPGMYVRAQISTGSREGGVLVPQQGITRDPKGNATAMVVGKDDKVEPREVKVSRTVGDQWLVDSGLAAGDRVIIEGLQKIGPGAVVAPTEAGSAPANPGASAPPGGAPPASHAQ